MRNSRNAERIGDERLLLRNNWGGRNDPADIADLSDADCRAIFS